MNSYVVTEGKLEAEFLRRILLSAGLSDMHVIAAGGKSSVISLARSILATRSSPVAVVLDADTIDGISIREQETVYYDLLRMASARTPFRLFFAIPEFEGILFHDLDALKRILAIDIPEEAIREARYQPKKVLVNLIPERAVLTWIIPRVDDDAAASMARHPLMRSLIDFLKKPTYWSPEAQAPAA